MPTITPILKKSTKKGSDYSKLRFYISVQRGVQLFYASDILVNFEHWDAKKQSLKPRAGINPIERKRIGKVCKLQKHSSNKHTKTLQKTA